jgi:hypothetical protein
MENEDIIALLALGVSILGSIVNGLYTFLDDIFDGDIEPVS